MLVYEQKQEQYDGEIKVVVVYGFYNLVKVFVLQFRWCECFDVDFVEIMFVVICNLEVVVIDQFNCCIGGDKNIFFVDVFDDVICGMYCIECFCGVCVSVDQEMLICMCEFCKVVFWVVEFMDIFGVFNVWQ